MGGEDKPFTFKRLKNPFKHDALSSIQVRGIFKAILITINENIHFSIASLSGVNPAITYSWILQIRLMLASWVTAVPPHHTYSTSPRPAPFPQPKGISTSSPSDHQPPPSPDPLRSPSASQHFSKTTKLSDREISSHNFPNLSMPGQVQPFSLLLWSPPVPKPQAKR